MRGWTTIVIVPLMACAGLAGCGASDTSPGTSASSGGGHGGAGGVSPAGGAAGGVTVGVGGGMECGPPCSDDLKQVLDCEGRVMKTCDLDMACLDGACSDDPCAAATAAKSGHGCEFWALRPERFPGLLVDGCFAVLIANTWEFPAHLAVRREGVTFADTGFIRVPQGQGQSLSYGPYDPAAGLAPGEVAIAFLSHKTDSELSDWKGCPFPAALDGDDGEVGTSRGQAFSIEADRPVGMHSVYPYGSAGHWAGSATLLVPASAWGTNYLAINPYHRPDPNSPFNGPGLQILAREDGTEVTLLPKVPIEGGIGVAPAPADAPVTYALGAGEYLQLSQAFELTGSVIESNKPIGVWGETKALFVPDDSFADGDSAHQQLPPVRALGSHYAGVRYKNRSTAVSEEAPPWRLVGAVDSTKLSWKPAPPAAGLGTLDQGQVVEFFAPGPFVVESQDDDHPFYLAQYMTSCAHSNPDPTLCKGDPEWVNVIPSRQYLTRYLFFTDPTYSDTNLVVVRARSPTTQQFADVVLDCAGPLTGWQPLDDALEYTRVDLAADCQPAGNCDNGRHEMTSALPFGVTVWGWHGDCSGNDPGDGWSSYAYPAGASLRALNDVVIPPTPE